MLARFVVSLRPLSTAALAALAVLLAAPVSAAAPNIVVIITDDQDTTSLAYMPKTRRLLAEEGITFTNSFVNFSLCAPSRASFLTGQAAHNHGIQSNAPRGKSAWENFWPKEGSALPVWLQEAGYRTAMLGKYLNGYGKVRHSERLARSKDKEQPSAFGRWTASLLRRFTDESHPTGLDWVPEGWDLWYAFAGSVAYFDYAINENGALRRFGDRPQDYSTDVLRDRAVEFIRDSAGGRQPFFLLITPKAAHGQGKEEGAANPPIPSPRYKNAFKDKTLLVNPLPEQVYTGTRRKLKVGEETLERKYRASLEALQSVDDLVEAVVAELDRSYVLDNTLIVYTSDNGFLFGTHNHVGKRSPYEGSLRVPLIVRGPGVPIDTKRDQLVNNLDVVATIEELARVHPDLPPDGRSLRPLFDNPNAPWRSALLFDTASAFGVRTKTLKYVRDGERHEQLYDLINDPQELKNEAEAPAVTAELKSLRTTLDRLETCAGASCWVP